MNYDKCVVLIESWQIQCCGASFEIGDKIEWIVRKYRKNSEMTGSMIEYYYENHDSEWEKLFKAIGTVDKINAMFCRYEKRPNERGNKKGFVNYPIYEKSIDVNVAYGSTDDGWHEDIDGLEFGEYEVTLRDCVIVPAKETEVTFS
jgi:hypothetical protein